MRDVDLETKSIVNKKDIPLQVLGDPPTRTISSRIRAGATSDRQLLSHALTGTTPHGGESSTVGIHSKLDPGQSPLVITPAKLKDLRDKPTAIVSHTNGAKYTTPEPSQYDAHADNAVSDVATPPNNNQLDPPTGHHGTAEEDGKPGWVDWLVTGLAVVGAVAAVALLPEVAPFAIALAAHAVTQVVIRHKGNYLTSPSGLMAGVVTATGAQMMFSGLPVLGAIAVSSGIAMSNEHIVKIAKEVGKDSIRLVHGSIRIVDYFSRYPWLIPLLGIIIAIIIYRREVKTFLNRNADKVKVKAAVVKRRVKAATTKMARVIHTPGHLPFWRRSGAFVS